MSLTCACMYTRTSCPCSKEDQEFVQQSTEVEMVQLFRLYDELCEQRQELENKLDEAEDVQLP